MKKPMLTRRNKECFLLHQIPFSTFVCLLNSFSCWITCKIISKIVEYDGFGWYPLISCFRVWVSNIRILRLLLKLPPVNMQKSHISILPISEDSPSTLYQELIGNFSLLHHSLTSILSARSMMVLIRMPNQHQQSCILGFSHSESRPHSLRSPKTKRILMTGVGSQLQTILKKQGALCDNSTAIGLPKDLLKEKHAMDQ